jgi:hypothetical protein
VKARVRELELGQCELLAKQTLRLESAAEVRDYVATVLA